MLALTASRPCPTPGPLAGRAGRRGLLRLLDVELPQLRDGPGGRPAAAAAVAPLERLALHPRGEVLTRPPVGDHQPAGLPVGRPEQLEACEAGARRDRAGTV